MTYSIIWLIAIIGFCVLESVTYQLVSIWFAGGAIAGFIASIAGANFTIQFAIFILVTTILLVSTRPLVQRLKSKENQKTNTDSIPGTDALVIEEINNLAGTGQIKINGIVWTARSKDDTVIPKGQLVTVDKIEGVKVIVIRKDVQ